MRIGPSLILASRQTLAMTPQLQQAIKLLQFSHLELAAYIQQELEKNPLLAEGATEDGPPAESEAPMPEAPADTAEALAAAAPALADADERWTREHADRGGDGAASRLGPRDDAPDALDFVSARPRSLAAHVLEQIELAFSEREERRIALRLAEGLDQAGYCRLEVSAVAEAISVSVEMVEAVWTRLRQMEPAGLFARTVSECLTAQLAERDRLDPAMMALLDNLDLVAAGELGQLRRRCGVDDEDLRDMLAELRTLDPRPGQAFDFEPIQPVAPASMPSTMRSSTPTRISRRFPMSWRMAEMRRTAHFICPAPDGWQRLVLDDAVRRNLLSEEELSEIEGILIFFMVASAMHRGQQRTEQLTGMARVWQARLSASSCTEFIASLPTSTPDAPIGERVTPYSIAS